MKAVRYHEYGDASVLRYEDADRPKPSAGEVLIQVAATSFNPVDGAIRAGYLQQVFPIRFPHTPGIDVAGTVAAVGPGVSGFSVGDPVIGFLPMTGNGAAAEFVLAPAGVLTAAPTSLPLTEAAAVPAAALTAWQALFELARLQTGQRILINGAGGGVGGFAVQFAKRAGAVVIATASARSTDTVRSNGADQIIDYTSTTLSAAITEPLDVVLSLVMASEPDMAALVNMVRPGGVMVTTGTAARSDPARNVRAISMNVRSDPAQLTAVAAKIDAGEVHVEVTDSYPLSAAARVHEQGAAGRFSGKVILIPDN